MPLVSDAKLGPYEIVGPLGAGGMDGVYRARGLPVVTSTRVPTGRVFPLSAARGSALALKKIGCVLADDLSPQKARILLMLALTKTRDAATLQNCFLTTNCERRGDLLLRCQIQGGNRNLRRWGKSHVVHGQDLND